MPVCDFRSVPPGQPTHEQRVEAVRREIRERISLLDNPDPASRESWQRYYRDWERVTLDGIRGSLDVYLAAKAAGHPHIRWLESMGFVFGPRPEDVRVPPIQHVLRRYLERMDELIASGFDPDGIIWPERVLYHGVDEGCGGQACHVEVFPTKDEFITVPIGGAIPPGYGGTTHLYPLGFNTRRMAGGVFPIGEPSPLATPAVRPYVTFLLHDIAHLAIFMEQPHLMPVFRKTAQELSGMKSAYPKSTRDWPDTPFTDEQVKFLRQYGLLGGWVLDQELKPPFDLAGASEETIRRWINGLPSETRVTLHTAYITNIRVIPPRLIAGLRYHYMNESASLLSKASAEKLQGELAGQGLLPPPGANGHYTANAIRDHLLAKGPEAVRAANKLLVERFPQLVVQYGAASRDIAQNALRFNASGPTGNTHYSTMDYLWHQARENQLAGAAADPRVTADIAGKLAAAAIESGHVDIVDWLANLARPVRKDSPLDIWFNQTGSFRRDDYWFAMQPAPDRRFVDEAQRILGNLKQTGYQLGVTVDEAAGSYHLDCSELVGYMLGRVSPAALTDLRAQVGRPTRDFPQAADYTDFFAALGAGRVTSTQWQAVPRVPQIQAGDVIAWKRPADASGPPSTGHMVVALGPPTPSPNRPGEWVLPIMDSTRLHHGTSDSRPTGQTGVGTGTITLVVDAYGRPTAYRWSTESPNTHATPITIGRISGAPR